MRRLPLALLLLAAPLRAAPPGVVACFQSLESPDEDGRPVSEGAGQDLGRWEWAPPKMHAAVAVPAKRNGRQGFYFYGDETAEFMHFDTPKIPGHMKSGAYWVVPLEIRPRGEGRGYFHCSYRWTPEIKGARPSFDCDFTGREPKYYAPVVESLKGVAADWAALETAALERVMSVHAVFQRRADKHGESLARWRKRNSEPKPGWASVADMAGVDTRWYFGEPRAPERSEAAKALAPCAALGDTTLGAAARTELKLLDGVVVPKP